MNRFTAETDAVAVVTAPRERVWAALTDPALVARLTPFTRRITEAGDRWHWELDGLRVLGHGFAPAFTEQMSFQERRRIEFRHAPEPGASEHAGVAGWYALDDAAEGTRLATAMAVTVELPIPAVARGAVRTAMQAVLAQMGDRFADNLLRHLDAERVS